MRKKYIFIIVLPFLFLFGCTNHNSTAKDGSYNKTVDSSISIPTILDDNSLYLETSPLSGEGVYDIINMISQNTMTGKGGSYSLQDVNVIAPIKQLRKCINTDKVYNVYKTEKGRFYVFYGEYSATPYPVVFYCYSERRLLFSDFDNIKKGKSTIDDVKKIDKISENFDNGLFQPDKIVNDEIVLYDDYSIHMTEEGVVAIGYKRIGGKLHVDYIKEHNDELIAGINVLDLP